MKIALTDHAIDEFSRHLKTGGNRIEVVREITSFFRVKPQLVYASAFTKANKFGKPGFFGTSTYLARISWKTSRALLVLVFNRGKYIAVTTLSKREFRGSVKSKHITEVGEQPILEDCLYEYSSLKMRVSPHLDDKGMEEMRG